MGTSSRRVAILASAGVLILACGLVVALSDSGLPLPAVVVLVALAICLLAIGAAGVSGYLDSRREGRGVWRSIGRAFRSVGRTWFELF